MAKHDPKKLFIVNPSAGKKNVDWHTVISDYFKSEPIEIFEMPNPCDKQQLVDKIEEVNPHMVVAAGGDGTVKLVAECIKGSDRVLGIIPGGSANGMAREFNIPNDPKSAMDILTNGIQRKIHVLEINDQLCIHLGDIGFNAYVIKKFEESDKRGMWGYVKAAWYVLWRHRKMTVRLQTDKEDVTREASMVVMANATQYGNGVVINPEGSLYDDLFEVVIIRKISFKEIFKMRFTGKAFDRSKTELFQTRSLEIISKHPALLQIDGELVGKIKHINARIDPGAVNVMTGKA